MIYLDHAATSPMDPRVLEDMMPYLTYEFGNPGSLHAYGREARKAVDKARSQTAAFFRCRPDQVIFTSGGTEGNNLVFFGTATELLRRNRHDITISAVEHDSVWKAAHRLCIKHSFHLHICPPSTDGEVKLTAIDEQISDSTGLVSVMLVNNETGVVNDIASIANACHQKGALIHTDAVQAAGMMKLDTKSCFPVDFMTVSSHKINGPKGTGALFVKDPSILEPLISGGDDQEFGFRGGTENVAGIVGFGKACELADIEYTKHLRYLTAQHSQLIYMLRSAAKERGVEIKINGDIANMSPKTLNICLPGVDSETLLLMLDAKQICLSAGSACRAHENTPSRVLKAMGISDEDARCSVRISISHLNTPAELDTAAREIIGCAAALKSL